MSDHEEYTKVNAESVDRWVEQGWRWGVPVDADTVQAAREGNWHVLLTPTVAVPRDWFGELRGKKVLGLASGGGQQMPIFAALGAECTVFDLAQSQLESERNVARREGYAIEIVQGDMTRPLPFADASFDLVFHPVSNVYVERVEPVFRECFRVLKPGGILLCGLDLGVNYWVDDDEERIVNSMPFHPLRNPAHREQLARTDSGIQFSHTPAEQIGGQLQAGFRLTNILDDTNGEGRLHELNIPTFVLTRAVKPQEGNEE